MKCLWTWLAACLAAVSIAPAAARADWIKAETDRFIVYGDAREATVRQYALKLSTYDAMLRGYHPSTLGRVPQTKLQLILVKGVGDLRRVNPRLPGGVVGFYQATGQGVFAVATIRQGLGADDTLFHEYAHHFMLENFPAAYPAWFTEGFAEYFMTMDISPEGVIKVGGYNPARVYSLFQDPWLPWDEILSKTPFEVRSDQTNIFYSQSWFLMHYMRSDDSRAAQLDKAITAINAGQNPAKAFWLATGVNPAQLTKALRNYLHLTVLTFDRPPLPAPAITVTRLPASADDLLLDNFRLLIAAGESDPPFLANVRRRAARHPDDLLAQMTLARAEFVMGDVAQGEAIVRRQLAARPDDVELLLLAGTGKIVAGLRDSSRREQVFHEARPLMGKVYALDKSDFRALYGYALCRSIEPGFPSENDLNALLEARAMAPAVQEISLHAGLALLQRGRREEALRLLNPVVNNPHGGALSARAKALIEGKSDTAAGTVGQGADGRDEAGPARPPAR